MLARSSFFLLYWTVRNYFSFSGFEMVLAALIGEWKLNILLIKLHRELALDRQWSHMLFSPPATCMIWISGSRSKKTRTKDLFRPACRNKCAWHSHSLGSLDLFLRLSHSGDFVFLRVQLKLFAITCVVLFLLNLHSWLFFSLCKLWEKGKRQ